MATFHGACTGTTFSALEDGRACCKPLSSSCLGKPWSSVALLLRPEFFLSIPYLSPWLGFDISLFPIVPCCHHIPAAGFWLNWWTSYRFGLRDLLFYGGIYALLLVGESIFVFIRGLAFVRGCLRVSRGEDACFVCFVCFSFLPSQQ